MIELKKIDILLYEFTLKVVLIRIKNKVKTIETHPIIKEIAKIIRFLEHDSIILLISIIKLLQLDH